MATSRTGTTRWKMLRLEALRLAQDAGLTNCPDCACVLDYAVSRRPNSAEPDHIVAVAAGGADMLENLRVACRECNQKRGNRFGPATPGAGPRIPFPQSIVW